MNDVKGLSDKSSIYGTTNCSSRKNLTTPSPLVKTKKNIPINEIDLCLESILSDKNKALESLEFLDELAIIDSSSSNTESEEDEYEEENISSAFNSSRYE